MQTTPPKPIERSDLPTLAAPGLLLAFGAQSVAWIYSIDSPAIARPDLLLFSLSLSALGTALIWFFLLALRRGVLWSLAMLVPYVNLLAASAFARRYWSEGARAPALLAIAGMLGETVASLRLLMPSLPPLV